MITLGKKYEDKITGFIGIATGYVRYITGCNQVLLAPKTKDGTLPDSNWIDESRLIELAGDVILLDTNDGNGFDKSAPIR